MPLSLSGHTYLCCADWNDLACVLLVDLHLSVAFGWKLSPFHRRKHLQLQLFRAQDCWLQGWMLNFDKDKWCLLGFFSGPVYSCYKLSHWLIWVCLQVKGKTCSADLPFPGKHQCRWLLSGIHPLVHTHPQHFLLSHSYTSLCSDYVYGTQSLLLLHNGFALYGINDSFLKCQVIVHMQLLW